MKYILNNSSNFKKITRLIMSHGFNANSLSKVLGCSRPTAKAKLESPEKLTLKDLVLLNNYGDIPFDKVSDTIIDWTRFDA